MAMWNKDKNYGSALRPGFSTPPARWYDPMRQVPTMLPRSERKPPSFDPSFHVIHKLPAIDSPYARAKHVQVSPFSYYMLINHFLLLFYRWPFHIILRFSLSILFPCLIKIIWFGLMSTMMMVWVCVNTTNLAGFCLAFRFVNIHLQTCMGRRYEFCCLSSCWWKIKWNLDISM